MGDDYERTLVQLPQVHVFKIPVRKSADGHRAADWPTQPTWSGKLKIVAKGRVAAIYLLDDKNQTFAVCPVTDDAAVERTLDSGRYYSLRIQNAQGKHAYIGIAFNERNDAFDFNVALAEHKRECEREDSAANAISLPESPMRDLSLKEGTKITINVPLQHRRDREQVRSQAGAGAGAGVLLPPPGGKGLLAPPPSSRTAHAPAAASHGSLLDTHTAQEQQQHVSSVFTTSDWGTSIPATVTVTASNRDPFADPFGASAVSDPFASSSFSSAFNTSSSDPFASTPSTSYTDPFATSGSPSYTDPFASNSSFAPSTSTKPQLHSPSLLDF